MEQFDRSVLEIARGDILLKMAIFVYFGTYFSNFWTKIDDQNQSNEFWHIFMVK